MKAALLLVDLQRDFLSVPGLEPAAPALVERVSELLAGCRALSVPVLHAWTTVHREPDRRMPHWKRAGRWWCVEGTEGHAVPPELGPLDAEPIVRKLFFSAFEDGRLEGLLGALGVDTLVVGGVHLHGCVRATVLDAYQRGFELLIAEDAVASDDPVHATATRRYLEQRAARFLPTADVLSLLGRGEAAGRPTAPALPAVHLGDEVVRPAGMRRLVRRAPADGEHILWSVDLCGPREVVRVTAAVRAAWSAWRGVGLARRVEVLERLARLLGAHADELALALVTEIGKPIAYAREEVARSIALLGAVAAQAGDAMEARCGPSSMRRYRPVGVIAIVTPWNNPLAIPLGKLAPALLHGNAVVWKPAPFGSAIALRLMELLHEAGCPPAVVGLVIGDRSTAELVMADARIDAVAVTGSSAAGYSAQVICARRRVPLQAELGGNNAAIVWSDIDLAAAAAAIAEGAFGFAGQRCTANRRAIVEARVADAFVAQLLAAIPRLRLGAPGDEATHIGPLVSHEARDRVRATVARATRSPGVIPCAVTPDGSASEAIARGAYLQPVVLRCQAPGHEIVQEETFGPVLVLQAASDWEEAMALLNGVRQGLAAALFSRSAERQERFLADAQAGILKLGCSTAGADVDAPFGGWKLSGVGPPEHGASNREFYTRTQALYR